MLRITFFTEPQWAFGTIHYTLCKRLYQFGIDAEVLDFFKQYTYEDMMAISSNTDFFVTTPVGVEWLLNYGVPIQQIKSVAHAQWDMLLSKNNIGLNHYKDLAGYGVVSQTLFEKSCEFGIERRPDIIPVGIEFDRFYRPAAKSLNRIGYAAAFESYNFDKQEIKRGRLVNNVCSITNNQLLVPVQKMHYLGMPSFYEAVDCVMMSSVEEGAGLPMLEAAAAGRMCIGTPVGYFRENSVGDRGGFCVGIEEDKYVSESINIINNFKTDSETFNKKCLDIQEFARENYDWSKHIASWVNFLS